MFTWMAASTLNEAFGFHSSSLSWSFRKEFPPYNYRCITYRVSAVLLANTDAIAAPLCYLRDRPLKMVLNDFIPLAT